MYPATEHAANREKLAGTDPARFRDSPDMHALIKRNTVAEHQCPMSPAET